MTRLARIACLALAALSLTGEAGAQYYPPPPGYGYGPPRYAFGRRCASRLPTAYGPRREICPIVRPRPIDEPCRCPPPPDYGPGPWLRGHVIP
jgi:hypothetical protein